MPCVEEVEFGVGEVAEVGVCAGGGEDFVVLAPDDQGRGLVLAEVFLPLGVEGGLVE